MIKRTLHIGNPAYLRTQNEQLVVDYPDKAQESRSVPIEDVGILVLDNPQITISQQLMARLIENNAAIVTCNHSHHPTGLLLNLDGHTLQSQRFKAQIEASEPLKKQLWQQTIRAKILNQAAVLRSRNLDVRNMLQWAKDVKSGDADNHEARASANYWYNIFPPTLDFRRRRDGLPPNNLLNYGYAILRATVARSLVGSGLLPTLGIFHRNQYNAYCLADDIMEPYRPWVDQLVLQLVVSGVDYTELTKELKAELLKIPALDIVIDGQSSPLMVGLQRTTASLARCFEGENRKILYPELK